MPARQSSIGATWDSEQHVVGRSAFGERLFPEVALRFATLTLRFRAQDATSTFAVSEQYFPFLVDPSGPVTCDFLCSLGEPEAGDSTPAFPSGGVWDLRIGNDGSEEMVFHYGRNRDFIGLALTFAPSFRQGTIVERELREAGERPATFGDSRWGPSVIRVASSPYIEYMVARLIPRHRGLHCHSSIAIADGGAYVFAGHSGAGKSTIAGLAEQAGAYVPSDDRTLITLGEAGAEAWGTPWHGDLPRKSPAGAPLRAVFLLQHDSSDYVEPLSRGRALKELYTRLIQPGLSADEVVLTLEHLERLLTAVPVALLHFRPTVAAVRMAIATYP